MPRPRYSTVTTAVSLLPSSVKDRTKKYMCLSISTTSIHEYAFMCICIPLIYIISLYIYIENPQFTLVTLVILVIHHELHICAFLFKAWKILALILNTLPFSQFLCIQSTPNPLGHPHTHILLDYLLPLLQCHFLCRSQLPPGCLFNSLGCAIGYFTMLEERC